MTRKTIQDIQNLCNNNPLFVGEAEYEPGSHQYFLKHTEVYIDDCFAGRFDPSTISSRLIGKHVLDLGCGPGLWIEQIAKQFPKTIVAVDLTENALDLARKRTQMLGLSSASFVKTNAENLCFANNTFDHVNCQGVIHHTPDTSKAFTEISRDLVPGGSFSVSVYYKNLFLRSWPFLKVFGKLLSKLGGGLQGRGREVIFELNDVNEIVQFSDCVDNPIGESYSKKELFSIVPSDVEIESTFLHFFPARSLPFPLPRRLHAWLDSHVGFMIYITGRKYIAKL